MIRGNLINIDPGMLVELQSLYASMDEIDASSGTLLLKKGSEESLADAAFRHKINGMLLQILLKFYCLLFFIIFFDNSS